MNEEFKKLKRLCKDLKLADEHDMADKVLCAIAAIMDVEDPKAHLSYSYVMRDLRKNHPEKIHEFQLTFKKVFEEAMIEGMSDPEEMALLAGLQTLDGVNLDEEYERQQEKAAGLEFTYNRMIKFAQISANIGDPVTAGRSIAFIIQFLLQRINPEQRVNIMENVKRKIMEINDGDLASKQVPPTTAIGQSINVVKNILIGYDPNYIRQILNYTVLSLQ